MPPPPVDATEQPVLNLASTAGIVDAMGRLRAHLGSKRWVGPRNRYATNTVSQLQTDSNAAGRLWSRQLGEYIAASAPTHCIDGWTFLGKALLAAMAGDSDTARHLGYYAELRGATSLLACGGLGIFSDRHFAIDGAGQAHRIRRSGNGRRGTHDASWIYLDHWAGTPDAARILSGTIKASGVTVESWVLAMAPNMAWPPMGEWLLKSFGLDLQQLVDDREARNNASYRPTTLRARAGLAPVELTAFVADLWSLMEPTDFATLDRQLVGRTMAQAFHGLTNRTPVQDARGFSRSLDAALTASLSDGGLVDTYRTSWLTAAATPDSGLIGDALAARAFGDPRHHLGVLARATCLLRLATGATRTIMHQAGIALDDAEFWWKDLAQQRGLWPGAMATDELVDQWQDVSEALEEVSEFVEGRNGSFDLGDLASALPQPLLALSRLEIVPFWELAS